MTPTLDQIASFVQQLGVPVALLFAFGWWIVRKDDQVQKRDEKKDADHRQERESDRDSWLGALKAHGEQTGKALQEMTTQLRENTLALNSAGEGVRETSRTVERIAGDVARAAGGR